MKYYYGPNGYQPKGEYDKAIFPENEKFIYFPPHDNTNISTRGYPVIVYVYAFQCYEGGHFYLVARTEEEANRRRKNIPWGGTNIRIKYCVRYTDAAWEIAKQHSETRDALEAQYDKLVNLLQKGQEVTAVEVPKLPSAIKLRGESSPQLALF